MTAFVSGHQLSRHLHHEIVAPMMARAFPDLAYGSALLGPGSDVLGYDTERSTDHDWGPRLTIVLTSEDEHAYRAAILRELDSVLPESVLGVPLEIPGSRDLPDGEIQFHHRAGDGRAHGIRIQTLEQILDHHIGVRSVREMNAAVWVTTPQQSLLELTAGPVFHDGLGTLDEMRAILAWYPEDVWRYQLAARWKRIGQIEPFAGRCGELGDELGSHLIAMALINDLMHLAFLLERTYAPYAKWLGTAFDRLSIASDLKPHLDTMRWGGTWQVRESGYVEVVTLLANRQNDLQLCEWVDPSVRLFHDRPYRVVFAERFANALQDAMSDQSLPRDLGGVDAFLASTDAMSNRALRGYLREWFEQR